MPKVLITRVLPDRVLERARARHDVELRNETDPLTPAEAHEALAQFDGIVPTLGDAFGAETFAGLDAPRCKVLANFGVGFNHIDATAARAVGVEVTNTPGAVTDATADIAMTLILSSCRRAAEGERIVRAGAWIGWQPTQFLGMHVTGRTVGIVGMGRIGKAIARRCHFGFGMTVKFFNRSPVSDAGVPSEQVDDLHTLLEAVDIAVLALPATPQTRHLIDADAMSALGPESYLVNIARGDIVDEAALVTALETRAIAGAGLDVYENEPFLTSGLAACENAVLLPHLGTSALEVREAMGHMALDNLDAVLGGQRPPNAV